MSDEYLESRCNYCGRSCDECPCCGNDQYCTNCRGCNVCTPAELKKEREERNKQYERR